MSHRTEIVRYTYRLRLGVVAERALVAEWHRCRFLWNEAVHQFRSGRKPTRAKLGKLLTTARAASAWLREGSQNVQACALNAYALALDHSFKVKGRGRPRVKKRKGSLPSLEFSRNGFAVVEGRLRLPKGVLIPVVWSRGLPSEPTSVRVYQDSIGKFLARSTMARKAADATVSTVKRTLIEYAARAGRQVVLVQPAYTTMTCSRCFARTKRLRLDDRTFACPACGVTEQRDRNAARTILAVAERGHTSVGSVRHLDPPSEVSGAA